MDPTGFESLCQMLLRVSGFEEVTVTGRTGDGGIDGHGLLRINPFVTFRVLFQCKRYRDTVPVDKIRNFQGAIAGRADKGVFITTGTYTRDAQAEARRDGAPPIELVDGDDLIEMFEQIQLGLKAATTYEIDYAFFDKYVRGEG